jgi:Vault protein inter-alpha-trypsin domain
MPRPPTTRCRASARFAFPRGEVVVIGTKLALTAGDDRASVEVARGEVRLRGERGGEVSVCAGEEATLLPGQAPVVASASSLADVMEWSDDKAEAIDAPALRGLGELRARRPGQTKEKDHAVRLAKHAVKVRVVDIVARTEVDETFANDTDEELEGIFRFPLPPGAQIEKLALEVDGKLVEGAFVDRDKGAAIWRGVIQNAAPKAPKPREVDPAVGLTSRGYDLVRASGEGERRVMHAILDVGLNAVEHHDVAHPSPAVPWSRAAVAHPSPCRGAAAGRRGAKEATPWRPCGVQ